MVTTDLTQLLGWVTMTVSPDPTDLTLDWIASQCRHLAASLSGLTDEQARTTRVPSGWTPLGMMAHVHESTVFWLRNVVLGEPLIDFDEDAPFPTAPEGEAHDLVAAWLADCLDACAAVRGVPVDGPPGWWPEGAWGGYRQNSVLGVLLHLLADNAAHTGQLDIVRELTDGGVWDFTIGGVRVP